VYLPPTGNSIPSEVAREQYRVANGYQKTGEVYTLRYTKTVMVSQRQCSRVSNINPYEVFTFVGDIKLTPWSDEWRDSNQIEPLNILDDGQFKAISNEYGDGVKTWGEPINNWTGINITEEKIGERTLFAGHEDVDEYTQDLLDNKDPNNPELSAPGQGNTGHLGTSTQSGAGKVTNNAKKKAGRTVAGGHRGGRNKPKNR
jgi:hypothetical protein